MDNIVVFTPELFQVGEMYSVNSRFEHTFIGECVQVEPDNVVFKTIYGNLPITPTMAVSDEYTFEHLKPIPTWGDKMMKSNIHHTTAEDIERMREYQLNRHRKLKELDAERKKNLNNVRKLMDFPAMINSIIAAEGGVPYATEEEQSTPTCETSS